MKDYSKLIPCPDKGSINTLCSASKNATKIKLFGLPLGSIDDKACRNHLVSPKIKNLIVTMDVGPFRATGLKPFLEVVKRVHEKVKAKNPALYKQLGSAGCLCVRLVRGGGTISSHSYGTAIDYYINGKLDPRGDNKVQEGLLELYKYYKEERIFWGAGFGIEDGMHFEASEELLLEWKQKGII